MSPLKRKNMVPHSYTVNVNATIYNQIITGEMFCGFTLSLDLVPNFLLKIQQ